MNENPSNINTIVQENHAMTSFTANDEITQPNTAEEESNRDDRLSSTNTCTTNNDARCLENESQCDDSVIKAEHATEGSHNENVIPTTNSDDCELISMQDQTTSSVTECQESAAGINASEIQDAVNPGQGPFKETGRGVRKDRWTGQEEKNNLGGSLLNCQDATTNIANDPPSNSVTYTSESNGFSNDELNTASNVQLSDSWDKNTNKDRHANEGNNNRQTMIPNGNPQNVHQTECVAVSDVDATIQKPDEIKMDMTGISEREGKKHVQEHERPSESHIIEMETNQQPPTSGEFLSPGQSQGSGITPYNMQSHGAQQLPEKLKGQFQQQAGVTLQAFGENLKPTLLQLCGQQISHHVQHVDDRRDWFREKLNSHVNETSHDSQNRRDEMHGVTSQQPATDGASAHAYEDEEMIYQNQFDDISPGVDVVNAGDLGTMVHPLHGNESSRVSTDENVVDIKELEVIRRKQTEFINRLVGENNGNVEQIGSLKKDIDQTSKEKERYLAESKKLEKEIDKNKKIMKKRDTSISNLQQKLKDEESSKKNIQKQCQNTLNEERARAKNIQQSYQATINTLEAMLSRKTQEYESALEKKKTEYEHQLREQTQFWQTIEVSLKKEIQKRDEKLQEQKRAQEDLLLRYSKLAGESLAMGNANVTDLSDPNRPTKLAEQFSELYDNDWTDAFEELADLLDEEKIKLLLKILQRAYELSKEMTATDWLSRCYYTTNEDHTVMHRGTDTCTIEHDTTQASEVRMEGSAEDQPMETGEDIVDVVYSQTPVDENSQGEDNVDVVYSQTPVNENSQGEDNVDVVYSQTPVDENSQGEDNVDVVYSQTPVDENSQTMDMEAHRTSVDSPDREPVSFQETAETIRQKKLSLFEVPVQDLNLSEREQGAAKMLPYIKKKILTKESRHVQSVITQCVIEEFKIQDRADGKVTKLFTYAAKCSEICLLMCVKDPPLYIDFLTDEKNPQHLLFSGERYKAYTKKGKHILYIVWPCLYLEKNGPLLGKGIAQGGNLL